MLFFFSVIVFLNLTHTHTHTHTQREREERRNWWNKLCLLAGGCSYMDSNRDSDIGIRFPWKLEQRKGKREELSCLIIRRQRFANLFPKLISFSQLRSPIQIHLHSDQSSRLPNQLARRLSFFHAKEFSTHDFSTLQLNDIFIDLSTVLISFSHSWEKLKSIFTSFSLLQSNRCSPLVIIVIVFVDFHQIRTWKKRDSPGQWKTSD